MQTSDRANSMEALSAWVCDARARTLGLVADLDGDQLIGPRLPTINPLLWEIAHAAWFQESWVLQHTAHKQPIYSEGARLWDSIGIDHELRWDLPLPSLKQTLRYLEQVRDAVLEVLAHNQLTDELLYFVKLSVFHEDMHTEAYTYTRQTLGFPAPRLDDPSSAHQTETNDNYDSHDVHLAGGEFQLGATPDQAFVFDNEKWAYPVQVHPFAISSTPVTQTEFAEFVDDDGYGRHEFWTPEGWEWRAKTSARFPVYWKWDSGWLHRHFTEWRPLVPQLPMMHVNWFEADAYCRWAGRRLPTEAEWELAATGSPDKQHYPWGEAAPAPMHANLDWQALGPVPTSAHPAGDSRCGCRQLIGNVWEWTSTTFQPFPSFVADPYKEYSRPCFDACKVLRGGCWATRSRLIRNTWRNFYRPDRRDVFAGFRTCALQDP